MLIFRRVARAVRYAKREEDFGPVLSAGVFLIGIGILVEILRRLGMAFVAVRAEEKTGRPD